MFDSEAKKIALLEDDHAYFNTTGFYYKEFPSLFNQIRAFALFIVQKAPESFKEVNLLEQQVSEIVKNAIKHGNSCIPSKKIRVWYHFDEELSQMKLIVEDEGAGFQNINDWNDFFDKRHEAFVNGDFEEMLKYAAFKTEKSDEDDGGNALFAAVEYWNICYGFNSSSRNKVVAIRQF